MHFSSVSIARRAVVAAVPKGERAEAVVHTAVAMAGRNANSIATVIVYIRACVMMEGYLRYCCFCAEIFWQWLCVAAFYVSELNYGGLL